jgi:hypothetical protein
MLVPKRDAVLAAVWRGARAQWDVLWEFLDGVAALAFQAKGIPHEGEPHS